MTVDDKTVLEVFEEAFRDTGSGCVRDCDGCDRTFYNPDESWTWEEGELEKLAANPKATPLPYSVGTVYVEGRYYVRDCDCWQKRALQIARFILNHDEGIAAFLTEMKKRLQEEADRAPIVTG